ncbi:MAG: COX15/CtaA family protein [Myxococcales bacterium]|nr:COX15/CtaA family protein [Myxococcales bacterium]
MLQRFAWGVLAFTLLVIVWGTFVRATGSGAGCGSHWPTCNGEVIPRAETIETAIELTHRLTSGLSFLLVVALMIAALRARPKGHPMRKAAVWSFVFMITESAVGAGIVLLRYVADDQSPARAVWVAVHLINTFLLTASLTVAARQSGEDAAPLRWRARGLWVLAAALGTLARGECELAPETVEQRTAERRVGAGIAHPGQIAAVEHFAGPAQVGDDRRRHPQEHLAEGRVVLVDRHAAVGLDRIHRRDQPVAELHADRDPALGLFSAQDMQRPGGHDVGVAGKVARRRELDPDAAQALFRRQDLGHKSLCYIRLRRLLETLALPGQAAEQDRQHGRDRPTSNGTLHA